MKDYSKELAEAMKSCLDSIEWGYDFDEEEGGFLFPVKLNGRVEQIMFCVDIGRYSYNISALLENLEIDATDIPAVSEYLHRTNSLYHVSRFELDLEEGVVSCTQCINCNGIVPSKELIEESIDDICFGVEHYADGLFDVIEGKGTPKAICDNYEKELM